MNSPTPRENPNRIKNARRQPSVQNFDIEVSNARRANTYTPEPLKEARRRKRAVFIQGGGPRNKAVSRDEIINDRRGAARLQVPLSEYRRLATQPGFPPYWTDAEGQPYRLVSDLDTYAETHGLVIQRDLFGEPK